MATRNQSDTFDVGGEVTVHRLGFGAMRLTGEGSIGPPEDEAEAREVLRRADELGVDVIDTAGSYGPSVSERLIAETLDADPTTSSSRRRAACCATRTATHSDVILPIPGTSSVDHLEENVAASVIDLSDDELARLDG